MRIDLLELAIWLLAINLLYNFIEKIKDNNRKKEEIKSNKEHNRRLIKQFYTLSRDEILCRYKGYIRQEIVDLVISFEQAVISKNNSEVISVLYKLLIGTCKISSTEFAFFISEVNKFLSKSVFKNVDNVDNVDCDLVSKFVRQIKPDEEGTDDSSLKDVFLKSIEDLKLIEYKMKPYFFECLI